LKLLGTSIERAGGEEEDEVDYTLGIYQSIGETYSLA
jgi:hypothetical protein